MVAVADGCYDPPLLAPLPSFSNAPHGAAGPVAAPPGPWRVASWGLAASLTTAALTWVLQVAIARFMEPARYAEALVLLAVFMVLAAPLVPILLVVTTHVVALRAEGRDGDARALLSGLSARTLAAGLVFLGVVFLAQDRLAPLLGVTEAAALPLLAAALVANALFLLGHAALLGELRWTAANSLTVVLAGTRLGFSLLFLAWGLGTQGVFLGLTASTVSCAALSQGLARRPLPRGGTYPGLPLRQVGLAVALNATFWFLVHVDLLYVTRLLPELAARGYGAVSTLGRMLVLVPFSVLHLMFPFLAAARPGRERRNVLVRMAGAAIALDAVGLAGIAVAPALILSLTYPPQYGTSVSLLVPVGAMLAPFGLVALLMYAALAERDRYMTLLFGVAAGVAGVVLAALPPSFATLVTVLAGIAASLLVAGALRASSMTRESHT